MTRTLSLILAVGSIAAAEVARRDLMLAIDAGDGGFAYTIDAPIGSFSGDDACDRLSVLRLGGRWAWASAGSGLAPLLGFDGERLDAPLSGGGLSGYGLSATAGGTWAIAERCAIDLEGFVGRQRVAFDLPGSQGTLGITGSGSLLRAGLRTRLLWHLAPRWSLGVEGAWSLWSADITSDDDRSLRLNGSGPSVGLAFAWRPSSRPGSIE